MISSLTMAATPSAKADGASVGAVAGGVVVWLTATDGAMMEKPASIAVIAAPFLSFRSKALFLLSNCEVT